MSKFVCVTLLLTCAVISIVHGQYKTDVPCTTLNECICKLPQIIGAVAGRKATANIRNPADGKTYVLDLSKPSSAVAEYCNKLKQGLKPALPFVSVDAAKLSQVQALLSRRAAALRG